jgi:hypothetical protein
MQILFTRENALSACIYELQVYDALLPNHRCHPVIVVDFSISSLTAGFDELKITDLISFLVGYLPLTNLG